jgi:glycyl-tRNA synthetase beta chain
MCNANVEQAQRAALLCKTDLLTDMVGEFPELQGNMGEHYALHDGEQPNVAQAIADHYSPRFAGDQLPHSPEGLALALADKLETLVGIYSIGLVPTGDKDPFALRRHALGIIRMVIEKNLNIHLGDVLEKTSQFFQSYSEFKPSQTAIKGFVLDRLRGYLKDQGNTNAEIESVLSQNPSHLADLPKRLAAVRSFSTLPEAIALAAANKRITNILKKAEETPAAFSEALLTVDAEKTLAAQVKALEPESTRAYEQGDFQAALALLAPLKTNVDAFFDNVMVNDDNKALRHNRIALLRWMHGLMNRVADISQLA